MRPAEDSGIPPMSVQHRATSSVGNAACQTPMSSTNAPQNPKSAVVGTLPPVKNVRIGSRRRTSFADDASSVPCSKSSSPRRGSRSRSASRSRPISPPPVHSSSKGGFKSRTGSGLSNRPQSKTPTGGKEKSSLTWADNARGNQTQAFNSQDSHDPRFTNELEELRRANDSLRKENAEFKQEISLLAAEMAKIRRLALTSPAHQPAARSSARGTLKNAISNAQTGLSHVQEMIAHPQLDLVALNARILRLEGTSHGFLRSTSAAQGKGGVATLVGKKLTCIQRDLGPADNGVEYVMTELLVDPPKRRLRNSFFILNVYCRPSVHRARAGGILKKAVHFPAVNL
ncbi:hypothetical protein HPB49_009670 [Dermacentor silvarum]|uniref:Uncharacterized protein n=1 Tax=Dermacentor silvarum TaxID=543639 RepID=A0ACB8DYS8_DERSI|nr:hypothetical protein HPB49_009670 [Dermacentor silvarum]